LGAEVKESLRFAWTKCRRPYLEKIKKTKKAKD
jgi:hypothetical protein